MAEQSSIEWTDATWNPITGCSVVSPGCTNCYAMRLAGTRLQHHPSRAGLTTMSKAGPVWNGEVRFNRDWLTQPLTWKRPRRIFVCAHGDLFHERVPDAWIDQVFAVMALCPQHTFQVLTKRAERMRAYMTERWQAAPAHRIEGYGLPPIDVGAEQQGEDRRDQVDRAVEDIGQRVGLFDTERDELWDENGSPKCKQYAWPLKNVWLGVSAEDQTRANERIPDLLGTPSAVRFVSAEPLIGPIDLCAAGMKMNGVLDLASGNRRFIDLVIAGGENGPRPAHPAWVRKIRDDCALCGAAFFFKQWGSWEVASFANGHFDQDMSRNAAHWLALDGTMAKPSCTGMIDPVGMIRVGKKKAGRLLDGITHDAMPLTT